MKLTELFLSELDREVPRSRRALEQVPGGKRDWKPHPKSMAFGYLCDMVATIPRGSRWSSSRTSSTSPRRAGNSSGRLKARRAMSSFVR